MERRRDWFLRGFVCLRSCVSVYLVVFSVLVLGACALKASPRSPGVDITILHLNDVYEITPVSGGKEGGLSRVATLRRQLFEKNRNTFTVLAGDLLSPSALGTAPVGNGNESLDGRQIVAVMNAMGLTYATFGNHEFDLKRESFLERLRESRFIWFSSNVRDAEGRPFPGVADTVVFEAAGESGSPVRVGLIGVTIDSNRKPYVSYKDPVETVKAKVKELRDRVDVLVAVTHLSLEQDTRLASEVPGLDLILGGHEHDNFQIRRGPNFTPIYRADANVRSVYVHDLHFDRQTRKLQVVSRFRAVDDTIPEDPETERVVRYWRDLGYEGFRKEGFDPEEIVAKSEEPLDGLEASVRNRPTRLTELIAQGMLAAVPEADAAIFNSGSVRIDDVLQPGEITVYDVIRIMPFGGKVLSVDMKGSLLKRVLDRGRSNRGTGGYLQMVNIRLDATGWVVNEEAIDEERLYRIAVNDFLLSGNEQGLEFLNRDNKDLTETGEHGDMRKALIAQLQRSFGWGR